LLNKLNIYGFYFAGILAIILSLVLANSNIYFTPVIPIFFFLVYGAIFHTEKVLWVITFFTPLSVNTLDVGFGLGLSAPTEPLLVIVFLLLVIKLAMGGKIPFEIIKHPLVIFVSINLIWMLLSVFGSTEMIVSLKYFMSRLWYVSVFFFLLIYLFKDQRKIEKFVWALIAGFACLVIYTTVQHAMEGFVLSHNFFIMEPFYPDHGMYAASIAFLVPITGLLFYYGKQMSYSVFLRALLLLVFIMLIVGIVFSFTRATWVSLAGAAGIYGLILLKVKFKYLLIGIGMVLAFFVIRQDQIMYQLSANKQGSVSDFEGHVESIGNISTDPSNMERINRWKSAVRMYLDRPILGFGPGTYVKQYGAYQSTEDLTIISTFSGDLGNAHSEYFSALTETGTIGFISWIGVFLLSVFYGFKLYYNSSSIKARILSLAAVLSLSTYYIHGFLNNYSDYDKIAIPLWGLLAVLVAIDLYHSKVKVIEG